MTSEKTFPHLLNEVIKRFLSVGNPQKMILFGSRATGKSNPESDYDFLVIEESQENDINVRQNIAGHYKYSRLRKILSFGPQKRLCFEKMYRRLLLQLP